MTTLDALAERVSRGESLDLADAGAVLDSYDLLAIGMMGDEVRRRMHGARTTFVRVCELHTDALPAALPPRVAAGEVRIVGRPAEPEAALAAVRAARTLAGSATVTGYTVRDLVALAAQGAGARDLFVRLKDAGLDAIAELTVDDGDRFVDAVREARQAGLIVARLTVESLGMPSESTSHDVDAGLQVEAIARARALQASIGGFRAFAPLPRTMLPGTPTTGYDDVKQIALARLVLSDIDSIQVDWALYGPKLAQVGLTVGADDVDGVAAADPGTLGTRRSPLEEIRGNIRAAALEPIERDGLWREIE